MDRPISSHPRGIIIIDIITVSERVHQLHSIDFHYTMEFAIPGMLKRSFRYVCRWVRAAQSSMTNYWYNNAGPGEIVGLIYNSERNLSEIFSIYLGDIFLQTGPNIGCPKWHQNNKYCWNWKLSVRLLAKMVFPGKIKSINRNFTKCTKISSFNWSVETHNFPMSSKSFSHLLKMYTSTAFVVNVNFLSGSEEKAIWSWGQWESKVPVDCWFKIWLLLA